MCSLIAPKSQNRALADIASGKACRLCADLVVCPPATISFSIIWGMESLPTYRQRAVLENRQAATALRSSLLILTTTDILTCMLPAIPGQASFITIRKTEHLKRWELPRVSP